MMYSGSSKDSSVFSSPFLSPNVSGLLKIRTISWSQETGLPVTVCVRLCNRTFNLHKHLLCTKSGYFKRSLCESNEVELPNNFPGGADTFEMIALFIYGSSTLVDPFNVAALRCAAEFLEMTEEYSSGNLCDRFDIYLNQVVFQSWDDTLIVLKKSQKLLPLAEELLIVSRCTESLAFMACMEILDPERRREKPTVTLEALANQPWNCETVEDILNQDLWIKDIIALPFAFFKRIIGSLRRQGMKEKYVSPIILFYANKWILTTKTSLFCGDESYINSSKKEVSDILQGIVDMLPIGEKASKVIPVGFYFSLLSRSLELGLRDDSMEKLKQQIVCLLNFAQVDDFLLPVSKTESVSSSIELDVMESIFSEYVSSHMLPSHTPLSKNSIVAELWDMYLTKVATDPHLSSKRFMELVETIPTSIRQTHDHLYRALNTYLMVHQAITQEERSSICKYLSCQKLSQEVCIEAVQNELMPLRLIVQALFVQQLNTQAAFKECSGSFRYTHCSEFSGSLSSSRCANNKSQNLGESPYMERSEGGSRSLGFLMQKDVPLHSSDLRNELSRKDFDSTSFRIQNLEQELISLKKTLQLQNQNVSKKREPVQTNTEPVLGSLQEIRPYSLEGRTMSKKRNTVGQVTSFIGSVNLTSQRKYASKLLKIFRRISLFGRGKSKRKPNTNGARPKQL